MTILSPLRDRAEYYRDQAVTLRRRASEVRATGNLPEAKRLDELAVEADKTAASLEEQFREMG